MQHPVKVSDVGSTPATGAIYATNFFGGFRLGVKSKFLEAWQSGLLQHLGKVCRFTSVPGSNPGASAKSRKKKWWYPVRFWGLVVK